MGFHAERHRGISAFARHHASSFGRSVGAPHAIRSDVARPARRMQRGLQRHEHHAHSYAASDAEPDRAGGARVTAPLPYDYGIVIAGHGSRDADGVREFELLVELVKQRANGRNITHGFLEFARPTIAEAVRANIAA